MTPFWWILAVLVAFPIGGALHGVVDAVTLELLGGAITAGTPLGLGAGLTATVGWAAIALGLELLVVRWRS